MSCCRQLRISTGLIGFEQLPSRKAKRPLFIILDKTSLSGSWPRPRGNVLKKQMWVSKHKPPKVKASQADYRGSITAVVMITHDEIVQKVLPQI